MPGLKLMIGFAAITAMVSVHLGQLLGISRMFYAMGKNGDLPKIFARIGHKYDDPHVALILTALIISVLILAVDFFSIISMAAFAILVYYFLANAAALRLEAKGRLYPRIFSWIGLISCIVLAFSLTKLTVITGFIVLMVGIVYYVLLKRNIKL